jgi:Na+/proline symporter
LGSPSAVYDLLVQAAARHPVEGNKDGSYLTMQSREGAIFFVINIVGNFGTVFLDNGYYNKAIAASPVHALPGYILGGLSWFAIPWLTATTMGLAALALENTPWFPTYPDRMADADVSAGLVLPYAAVAILGKGGAIGTLLIVFMAVTSATSSQLIAVSTICTYDLYRTYFNPEASGRRLIYMSHAVVIGYGIFIATFSVGLWFAGISMGFLYLLMGVVISAAVLPATLALIWSVFIFFFSFFSISAPYPMPRLSRGYDELTGVSGPAKTSGRHLSHLSSASPALSSPGWLPPRRSAAS